MTCTRSREVWSRLHPPFLAFRCLNHKTVIWDNMYQCF